MINSYYGLEREQDAKLMDEAHQKSFLSYMGYGNPYIIVRANSWRAEGSEVAPLTNNEFSRLIDFRMYKYPERLERIISTKNSRF
jgi:hypothetical protein